MINDILEKAQIIVLQKVEVTENLEIAPRVFVLKFRRDFTFIPGQVIKLAMTLDEKPRMYSIASGTRDEDIWILFNIKPGGEITPQMASLKPGDDIFRSEPSGNFYGSAKPSVWIASGTGIAPYLSMWRSGINKDKMIIHGGRFLHSFYFENEFRDILGNDYIRCCSREPGEGVFHGRITKWLSEAESLPINRKYYLCGSAEMVVEVRDIL
nr:oxidoreductase [Bacteroidota bacterium]